MNKIVVQIHVFIRTRGSIVFLRLPKEFLFIVFTDFKFRNTNVLEVLLPLQILWFLDDHLLFLSYLFIYFLEREKKGSGREHQFVVHLGMHSLVGSCIVASQGDWTHHPGSGGRHSNQLNYPAGLKWPFSARGKYEHWYYWG